MKKKRIIIVGGGHNGLVAAAYLAREGHDVTVFENRANVGGCASSDSTTFPGFTLSSASYLLSLLLPEIVRDLNLHKHGFKTYPRNPSSYTPLPDGRYLLLGPDMASNVKEISKFSVPDAKAYQKYEEVLGEIAEWMSEGMKLTPPNIPPKNWRDWKNLWCAVRHLLRLNPKQMILLTRLMFGNAERFLDSWFETEALKATLLTDALIGAVELNLYVLLHHVMGSAGGERGVWAYVEGGMGGLSLALAKAAESYGAKIVCNTEVLQIREENSEVKGVTVKFKKNEYVTNFDADIVVSNLDPYNTFVNLLADCNLKTIKKATEKIKRCDRKSGSMKVNCTLSGLPEFFARPEGDADRQELRGTIHISPDKEYILKALEEGKQGKPSTNPILEITTPSTLDKTISPPGQHVMNIFVQFTPYTLREGAWDPERKWAYFEQNILPTLRLYIKNIDEILLGVQILSPLDLEKEFGITGGNIFHGGLGRDQLFSLRPIRGYADYRCPPIKGVYFCGSGWHPGGGVTGGPGSNATREILADIKSGIV